FRFLCRRKRERLKRKGNRYLPQPKDILGAGPKGPPILPVPSVPPNIYTYEILNRTGGLLEARIFCLPTALIMEMWMPVPQRPLSLNMLNNTQRYTNGILGKDLWKNYIK